jgi:hypothetical protein
MDSANATITSVRIPSVITSGMGPWDHGNTWLRHKNVLKKEISKAPLDDALSR